HKGIELEFAYKVIHNLMYEGLLSVGDWKWTSSDSARLYDDNQNLDRVVPFDAKGIYVGDAAKLQTRHSLRWEIVKDLYIKGALTYFGKYYSEFDPLDLNPEENDWAFDDEGNPRQSWKIPDYFLVDLHAGYGFKYKGVKINLRCSIINILDEKYISDADNNDSYSTRTRDFDAKSAGVFFGLGRRFNTSLKITF
ncbi:MAG: hypothetical protein K8S00_03080, partial [Bacteroidales bacterium]|nr:hypothetical protein [Bacteroidales bacterium]